MVATVKDAKREKDQPILAPNNADAKTYDYSTILVRCRPLRLIVLVGFVPDQ